MENKIEDQTSVQPDQEIEPEKEQLDAEPETEVTAQEPEQPDAEPETVVTPQAQETCPSCGAPMAADQAFCTSCGAAKAAPAKRVCSKCGAELAEGQSFCPKCGQKVDIQAQTNVNPAISQFNAGVDTKNKKSKMLPIVIAAVLAVCVALGVVISGVISDKKAEEAMAAYKTAASEFYSAVSSDALLLEDIGSDIVNNWHDYIYDDAYTSIESAVLMAQIDHADDISTVKENYDKITSAYKNLLDLPENSTSELEEIKDAVKGAYDAYVDFYETVMDVSGNYRSFSDAFHTTDSTMASAIKKLGNLVS